MLMPFTFERWALVQKKNILAGKQETVLASYAGSTRRTGKMRSQTSTPENQEGQARQKGRHERRQDSKWAKCTLQCMFGW
jgi:hypothetical protein